MSRFLRLFALLAVGSLATLAITAALLLATDPSDPASAQAIGGPVFVSGDDAEDHCEEDLCGGLMAAVLKNAIDLSLSPGTGIAAIGMEDDDNTAGLNSWNDPGNGGPNVPITVIPLAEISTVDFSDYAVIFVPSNEHDGSDDEPGISDAELTALNDRQDDIVDFVNNLGGGLIALTEQDADPDLAFGYLPLPLEFANVDYEEAEPTAALAALAPDATTANMEHGSWHNVWTGPPGYSGLDVLATAVIVESELDGFPALLGGARVILRGLITLAPETATNTVGEDHTVTANVTDGVDPIESVEVTFEVTDGPNAGDSGSGTTDANGDATFTYTGDGGAGSDTIQACFLEDLEVEHCVTATKDWVEAAVTPTPTPTPTVAAATATPTPSPTVAAAVQLPTTGGTPSDGGSSALPWLAAIAGAIALIGSGSAWFAYQRRRVR